MKVRQSDPRNDPFCDPIRVLIRVLNKEKALEPLKFQDFLERRRRDSNSRCAIQPRTTAYNEVLNYKALSILSYNHEQPETILFRVVIRVLR